MLTNALNFTYVHMLAAGEKVQIKLEKLAYTHPLNFKYT